MYGDVRGSVPYWANEYRDRAALNPPDTNNIGQNIQNIKIKDALDLPPLRLKFVARAIERKRALDKLAIFDAKAALIDEKSLNRLNRELREAQK